VSRNHPSRTARAMSRRTALGALAGTVLAGVATAGCGTAESPRTQPDAQPASSPEDDPDTVLLRSVVAEVDEVVALLEAVRRRERALRRRVAPLLDVHRRHRALLASTTDVPPPSGRPRRIPRGKAAATEVSRRERRLADRLADAAGQAESGTFARVLASMSASLHQHLEVA